MMKPHFGNQNTCLGIGKAKQGQVCCMTIHLLKATCKVWQYSGAERY